MLQPDLPQRRHRRHLPQPGWGVGGPKGGQQGVSIGADGGRQRFPLRGARRQPLLLEAALIARHPLRRAVRSQPVGRHHRQAVEGVAHALPYALQPVEPAHGCQYVGGVRALRAACFQQLPGAKQFQQRFEQQQLGRAGHQAGAKLAEHAVIEARVGQLQPQQILPVEATAHGVGGLAVREMLGKLQQDDSGQPPGSFGGLPPLGIQGGKRFILEEGGELIAQGEIRVAFGKGGAGDARGLHRHGLERFGTQRHGPTPDQSTRQTRLSDSFVPWPPGSCRPPRCGPWLT